ITFLRIVISIQPMLWSMIFSENRYPLFGIMLLWGGAHLRQMSAKRPVGGRADVVRSTPMHPRPALRNASPVEGSIPLVQDGKIIGAIGASGATARQDGQVAKVGADAFEARARKKEGVAIHRKDRDAETTVGGEATVVKLLVACARRVRRTGARAGWSAARRRVRRQAPAPGPAGRSAAPPRSA